MLRAENKNTKGDRKDLRRFGLSLGLGFTALGTILLYRGIFFGGYLFFISLLLLLYSLLLPEALLIVKKFWLGSIFIISLLITRLILCILFYVVITPLGVILRLWGVRFLETQLDDKAPTYWNKRQPLADDIKSYEKQF
jgi:hypothetical protein